MATWRQFSEEAPELAGAVERRFGAHRHKVMASVRADGSPRLCGTEVELVAGELWIGGMAGARRFADLRRDPRVAVHSGSDEPDRWSGDARLDGRAVEAASGADRERVPGRPGRRATRSLRVVPRRPDRGDGHRAGRREEGPGHPPLAPGSRRADDPSGVTPGSCRHIDHPPRPVRPVHHG